LKKPHPGAGRSDAPVRVMVVDDSAIARAVFARIVRKEPDLELAALAATAEEALGLLGTTRVDVILLDLEMPGMGGLDALPRMIAAVPGVRIMVVSSLTVAGAEHTLAALSLGAADTLAKPQAGGFDDDYRERLLLKIRALGRTALRSARLFAGPAEPRPAVRPAALLAPRALAIGASTGGIHALTQLLGALPARIGIPILVTQHLPDSFMEALARQLHVASGREAVLAQEAMPLVPDQILIAPGDAHLTVVRRGTGVAVRLDRKPAASGCMPSVDPMFASLVDAYDGQALGIVLSGMGKDGTEGARALVGAGGTVLAQDEATCAVWGMPGSVARAGLASSILPPDQLATRIAASVRVR
jgi:two-component system chemotaxis response regulator CheB